MEIVLPALPPNKISRVEITLSFAITPLINEVQILQSPSPSGAKIGTSSLKSSQEYCL